MDAVILAGGKGTRLKDVISEIPKPMAVVGDRPFLEWLILSLRAQGIRRFVLCLGYKGEVIESYFEGGEKWGVKVEYSRETTPLGTGGALRNAAGLIQSDPFLLLNGDSYCRVDVQRFKSEHEKFKARATLWVLPVEDCGRYGSIQIGGGGVVTAFKEKSESHLPGLINSGVYMLSREFVTSIQPGLERSIEREVFPEFIGNGLYATTGEGPFLDIGTPEAYGAAWQALKEDLLMLTPNEKPTEIQKFRPPSKGGLNP